ncbi:alpha-L-fucosidase [Planctomycetota bacterium]
MRTVDECTPEDTSGVKCEASEKGIKRFLDGAYGFTAHWGLYCLSHKGGEWIYYMDRIPFEKYKKRMDRFNPVNFNAEEWGDLMLEAGHTFFMITAKHHDGFCMYDSALTEFKISNTAFKRDVIAELAAALRDRGIALHFYYSLVDWTHPAYRNDWPAYVDYYQGQIRELCSNYGELGGILFDGYWPRQDFDEEAEQVYFTARGDWDLAGTYDIIHSLQPDAVVVNNSHIPPVRGEDYQIWELDLPGENTIGFNCTEVGGKPKACWWNINSGWSYQPWNHKVKTAEELFATYQTVREQDAVFLINSGPRSFGDIHPQEQHELRRLGQMIRAEGKD